MRVCLLLFTECLTAKVALEKFLLLMKRLVVAQSSFLLESFRTFATFEGTHVNVVKKLQHIFVVSRFALFWFDCWQRLVYEGVMFHRRCVSNFLHWLLISVTEKGKNHDGFHIANPNFLRFHDVVSFFMG